MIKKGQWDFWNFVYEKKNVYMEHVNWWVFFFSRFICDYLLLCSGHCVNHSMPKLQFRQNDTLEFLFNLYCFSIDFALIFDVRTYYLLYYTDKTLLTTIIWMILRIFRRSFGEIMKIIRIRGWNSKCFSVKLCILVRISNIEVVDNVRNSKQ